MRRCDDGARELSRAAAPSFHEFLMDCVQRFSSLPGENAALMENYYCAKNLVVENACQFFGFKLVNLKWGGRNNLEKYRSRRKCAKAEEASEAAGPFRG